MDQHSTTAELKSMILSFRVNELQSLLSYAGKNRTGKKNELLQRAMDLLRGRNSISHQIQHKIRELHLNKPSNCMWNNSSNSATTNSDCMPIGMMPHETMINNNQSGSDNNVSNGSRMCNIVNMPDQSILQNINTGMSDFMRSSIDPSIYNPNVPNTSRSIPPNQATSAPLVHNPIYHQAARYQQQPIPGYHNHHYRQQQQTIAGNHSNDQQQTRAGHANINYAINSSHHQPNHMQQVQYSTTTPITEPSNVKFKVLPFFPLIEEIIKPVGLFPSSRHADRLNETSINFSLTSTQADKIAMSSLSTNPRQFSRPILLRFCHCVSNTDQDDNFPTDLLVEVNRKHVELPPAIHNPNKPDKQIRRPGRHLDITSLCKLCPYTNNHIIIRWVMDAQKPQRNYAITVVLAEKRNSNDLIQDIQARGLNDQERTRSLVKEKLVADADCDIATTVLRGTLICPLGKMRMRTPCRSSQCNHIQCFDALLYLQMNERKPSWICPVCDKPALFKDLLIDGLFTDILNETPASTTEVQFYENGSWSVVPKKEDNYSRDIKPPAAKRQCLEPDQVASGSNGTTNDPSRRAEIELVCISDSSDEDDVEDKNSDKTSQASGTVYSITSSPDTEELVDIPDLPVLSPETVDANFFEGHPVTSSVFCGDFGKANEPTG